MVACGWRISCMSGDSEEGDQNCCVGLGFELDSAGFGTGGDQLLVMDQLIHGGSVRGVGMFAHRCA